ncbi:hypothetical protein A3860_08900 [Niastella vici]|uniref:O-antigen polymerase n=1 Tax=Niastella vici TaxID=1703345 RepID=A0A1V9FHQ0_9BACT|nr:hypothetical protein [Niastella vici]OQP57736.1 hypothetical protein A3860_08900 [Niastella vici]
MTPFFWFVEIVFFYGLFFYCLLVKNELSIFYMPVLLFVDKIIGTTHPAFIFYGMLSLIVIILILKSGLFIKYNVWAILISIYFLLLLNKSHDLDLIRPYAFSVTWFFVMMPIIPALYKKIPRDVAFRELSNASFLILALFIVNALFSTHYKFAPTDMYGFTNGILYGNLWAAAFNTMPFAFFVVFLKGVSERKLLFILLAVASFFFIMLTLRRTVMGLSALSVVVALLTMMTQQKAKMVFLIGGLVFVLGYLVYANTGFMQEIRDRVEERKLDDRALTEEKRFIEYSLIYNDMFVYHAYSPWFGFELWNSAGNYGHGVLGDRSLHGDLTNIVHSSGFIGLTLYLLMVATAFWQALKASKGYQDKLIILFCALSFGVFTVTGRYTETAATTLLFLVLLLPLTKNEDPEASEEETPPVSPEAVK